MDFTDAIKTCFSKYVTFDGRARRSEYWFFELFVFLVHFGLGILSLIPLVGFLIDLLIFPVTVALLIPTLSVTWRRLHDTGKSGLYFLFILIPIVGSILLIVWCCEDSNPGTNEYGPSPKAGNTINESNII